MATLEQIMRKKIKQLERDIEIASEPVAQVVENEMKENIRSEVYGRPPSAFYDRSMGFLNATTHRVQKVRMTFTGIIISTWVEPELMGHTPFTEHSSWVDGSDQRGVGKANIVDTLPYWINYGHRGLAPYTGAFYIESTIQDLQRNKKHVKELSKQLRRLGYRVK